MKSYKSAYDEINESNVLLFNLIDVIPLKLHKKENFYALYFLSKSPNEFHFTLKSIHFDCINFFKISNTKFLNKLISNNVSTENVITLKNIEINKYLTNTGSNFPGYEGKNFPF